MRSLPRTQEGKSSLTSYHANFVKSNRSGKAPRTRLPERFGQHAQPEEPAESQHRHDFHFPVRTTTRSCPQIICVCRTEKRSSSRGVALRPFSAHAKIGGISTTQAACYSACARGAIRDSELSLLPTLVRMYTAPAMRDLFLLWDDDPEPDGSAILSIVPQEDGRISTPAQLKAWTHRLRFHDATSARRR